MKLKDFKKFRFIFLLICLLLAILIINPTFDTEGVVIKGIEANSSAADVGITFNEKVTLRSREVIKAINDVKINDIDDYSSTLTKIKNGEVLRVRTNKREYIFLKTDNTGLIVGEVPSSNIRKGLDLEGGTRALLRPVEPITDQDRKDIMDNMEFRLNTYGFSDIIIKSADDITTREKYIVVEAAGVTQKELKEKVTSQGKFEAKIGNETVFFGGEKDIIYVCRQSGTCSGIRSCDEAQEGYSCKFEFQIKLSDKAATKHAEVTKNIPVNMTTGKAYLTKTLDLYLDDKYIDNLLISSELKGKPITDILISGPGFGATQQEASDNALANMRVLQTVLISGSLPVKLEIERLDSISPTLGEAFIKNALYAGLFALLTVGVVIFIRYRRLKITLPIMFTIISEVLLTIGTAALLKINIDLAAIAGIIAAVGTGVDDQIVITDEVIKGGEAQYNWKEKIKKAFFIIFVAYAATVAAMIPLFWVGAGLLTGFAITTIIGVTVGVLITRPAYASIVESLMKED